MNIQGSMQERTTAPVTYQAMLHVLSLLSIAISLASGGLWRPGEGLEGACLLTCDCVCLFTTCDCVCLLTSVFGEA